MSNLLNPCGIILVSRQRLLDRDLLSDATPLSQLSLPAQLQLVLLEFLPSERERDQEFLAACAENRVEPWLCYAAMLCYAVLQFLGFLLHLEISADFVISSASVPMLLQLPPRTVFSAVMCAVFRETKEKVEEMLQLPQNPNTFGNGRGALHIAAEDGFLQSLQLLLEAKADKDVTLEIDYTPLHLATRNGHLEDRVKISGIMCAT